MPLTLSVAGVVVPIPTTPVAVMQNGVLSGEVESSTNNACPLPSWVIAMAGSAEVVATATVSVGCSLSKEAEVGE